MAPPAGWRTCGGGRLHAVHGRSSAKPDCPALVNLGIEGQGFDQRGLSATMNDVRERFSVIADKPVSRHLDTDAPVLCPDQPLVAVMFYLFHGRNFLPVVERDSGLLVGVIQAWDILESIARKD